jgi:hypothetical protein
MKGHYMPSNGFDRGGKKRPLLVDRFIHRRFAPQERLLSPLAVEQMQRAARKANKFVLDEEAAERVARVVLEVPDLLVREHQFARAPYDITWIEFPAHVYWETLRNAKPAAYDAQGEWGQQDTADHSVGYLIDHGRVNTITGGTVTRPDAPPFVTPLQYRLNTEWPLRDQIEFAQLARMSRLGVAAAMWGSTFDHLNKDDWKLLRDNNVMEMVPVNPNNPTASKLKESLSESIRGAVGDVRTVIALLLMLNRPSITRYRQVHAGRGFVRGKSMPYMSHTVVNVSLDAVTTLRNIGTEHEQHVEKRRHEVRGHYCHDETARDYARIAGCIHEYQPHDENWRPWPDAPADEVNHWVCAQCGGRRWWRKSHMRGSAIEGFVVKDGYQVTSG